MGLHLTRAAVLGRPIGHSLSPALHRAAYAALGLAEWTFAAIDCGADDLAGLVGTAGPEWAGFSVTMPGKRAALAFAAHRTPAAELVGAANTLLPGPDGWTAANTDVDGIVRALESHQLDSHQLDSNQLDSHQVALEQRGFVLLGAGGTAQAAVVAARRMGVMEVRAIVREPARAGQLRATAERAGVSLAVHAFGSPEAEQLLDDGRAGFENIDFGNIVISTLPPHAADPFADRDWPPTTVVLDAVYAGWPTALARAVSQAGGTAINGVEILLYQAAEQVRLMTGHEAPLDAMRAAVGL